LVVQPHQLDEAVRKELSVCSLDHLQVAEAKYLEDSAVLARTMEPVVVDAFVDLQRSRTKLWACRNEGIPSCIQIVSDLSYGVTDERRLFTKSPKGTYRTR
jgi:hypothetical protein